MTGWGDVLDAFQSHVAAQRHALAEGRPQDVQAFVPPAGLGPLPPHLADPARAAWIAADALTAQLSAETAAAARQLQLLSVLHSHEQATSSFVDTRA